MNIENIYLAVESDEMNSPLVTICYELLNQGYDVKVEEFEFVNDELSLKLFEDLEKAINEFNIEIVKEGMTKKFKLVFTDYHKFNFQSC